MNRIILRYGLLAGLVICLLFLGPLMVQPFDGLSDFWWTWGKVVGYGSMVLALLCIYLGVARWHQIEGRPLGFGRALALAMGINVVASLVFFLGNIVLYEVIQPDFLTNFAEAYEARMLDQAKDEAARAEVSREMANMQPLLQNSVAYAALMAASAFLIGLVISLITAVIFRKKS